jgi:hypothetical protein
MKHESIRQMGGRWAMLDDAAMHAVLQPADVQLAGGEVLQGLRGFVPEERSRELGGEGIA